MTGQNERIADIEGRVADLVRAMAPTGWKRIDLHCTATVAVNDVALVVLTADGKTVTAETVPPELTDLLMELRRAHYLPEQGTWFSVLFLLAPDGGTQRLYNYEFDPEWDPPIPLDCWRRDQIVLPRDGVHVPPWLRDRLEGREPRYGPALDAVPLNPVEQMELISDRLTILLAGAAPPLWQKIFGYYQAVGDHVEGPAFMVFRADGTLTPWTPPAASATLFDRLKAGMHGFQGSTWTRADLTLLYEDGRVRCQAAYTWDDEPKWNTRPTPTDIQRELERFPRPTPPTWMTDLLTPPSHPGATPPKNPPTSPPAASQSPPDTAPPPAPAPPGHVHARASEPAPGAGPLGDASPGSTAGASPPGATPSRTDAPPQPSQHAPAGTDPASPSGPMPPGHASPGRDAAASASGAVPSGHGRAGTDAAASDEGAPGQRVRRARVFDHIGPDGERPSVSRPPVPVEEAERVLAYLRGAPVVMAARSNAPDQLDPSRGSQVPLTFHTDGVWTWSGAVAYYLAEHGVPPEPDLVAHIRARGFGVPEVDDAALDAANAAITGRPVPERTEPPRPALNRRGPIARLKVKLEELEIHPSWYRVDEVAEGAWCLLREQGERWTVFRASRDGRREREIVFDDPEPAIAQLLGTLVLNPKSRRPLSERLPETIEPLAGEPPLSLFRDRTTIELPTGTVVDRYGDPGGNVVYAGGTPFVQRSLPPDWENRPLHTYRVERLVKALTGTAVPWFEQPGGGTGFVLPRPITELLDNGTLVEL
ncbi:glycohydrolase toxin TNT-related protein [Spirillospora sp. CA-294931]|uniref:TNT domain-containing protein n=1 Tax=Spirillospora sp. CA-294931 TaxID=3240042 RepID=UPI003D93A54A